MRKGRFTAGTETRYRPSVLTGEPTHQALAEGFVIGMRFHSAPAIRLAYEIAIASPRVSHMGGALSRFSLFALGIMPYVTASIIFQLLGMIIPRLEEIQKDGEAGQQKIAAAITARRNQVARVRTDVGRPGSASA